LPVIDDEFAKDVSEFDTLEDYKAELKKKLTDHKEHMAKHKIEEEVIDKVTGNATVEIPEVMIESQIERLVQNLDARLRYQGLDLEKYIMIMGIDQNTLREQLRPEAEKEVKTQLVLEKLYKVENITASEEELEEEIKSLAENYKQDVDDFKKHLKDDDIEYIKTNLEIKKLVDFLVENAKIA